MNSIFLSRIPRNDLVHIDSYVQENRAQEQELEFIWHPRRKTHHDYSIFAHITRNHYSPL
jgi:hypothetical protein